jgi:hypothetical protein
MVRAEAALPKLPNLSFAGSAYEACAGADALLVLTVWEEFYDLDLLRMVSAARRCGRGNRLHNNQSALPRRDQTYAME